MNNIADDRFKPNFNQTIALMIAGIGMILEIFSQNFAGKILVFFGLLIFLLGFKFGKFTMPPFIIIILGVIFKILHWPFANNLILTGLGILFLSIFIHIIRKKKKVEFIFIFIAFLIFAVGIAFNIFHLKFNTEIYMTGLILIALSYLYRFLLKIDKNFEDITKLIIVLFGITTIIFMKSHWPYQNIFAILFNIALWGWLIFLFLTQLKSDNTHKVE